MAAMYDVYKCEECGNVVMVMNFGGGDLVCCGQNMVKQDEKTADSATEKHVPVIEKVEGGYTVTVGSTLHPMTDEHWIQWIELVVNEKRMIQELKPGDQPVAQFCCNCEDPDSVSAREFCNLHGLWKGEL